MNHRRLLKVVLSSFLFLSLSSVYLNSLGRMSAQGQDLIQITMTPSLTPTATVSATMGSQVMLPIISRPFSLVSPADGAKLALVDFSWKQFGSSGQYTLEIASDSDFNNILFSETRDALDFRYFSALNGDLYWRVTRDSFTSEVRSISLVSYAGDDDGDSLPNGWEMHGYDAEMDGTLEVDLPALGADYQHSDIFVEMDYMARADALNGLGPNLNVLTQVIQVFANAPITNPNGLTGINLHLELDDELPYDADLNPVWDEFYALKNTYFNFDRAPVYHYMIWANQYSSSQSSGLSFGVPSTDFIVTLGGDGWNGGDGGTDNQKIGTFVHELGHNLGLLHGGFTGTNYKPNYVSVMNYYFQIRGVFINGQQGNYDFQRFPLPILDETQLSEPFGMGGGPESTGYQTILVCPNFTTSFFVPVRGPVDFNCDLDEVDIDMNLDLNADGLTTQYSSRDDWATLVFNGGGIIGSAPGSQAQVNQMALQNFLATEMPEELTPEMQAEIDAYFEEALANIEENQ